jgi:hypothetical protein
MSHKCQVVRIYAGGKKHRNVSLICVITDVLLSILKKIVSFFQTLLYYYLLKYMQVLKLYINIIVVIIHLIVFHRAEILLSCEIMIKNQLCSSINNVCFKGREM